MAKGRAFSVATDTATLALFDVSVAGRYSHHQHHDWWTMWEYALSATNAGEVAVIDLGTDGTYSVEIVEQGELPSDRRLEVNLRCPTGTLFVGPGEDIPAGGLEPDATSGGRAVAVGFQKVRCVLGLLGEMRVGLAFEPLEGEPINSFVSPTRLRPD